MCQVMGYELDVPTGAIVRRMSAKDLAKKWQKGMAWKFQDPGPAEYCNAENRRKIPGCIGHDW
jgi:hypothetical protein